MHKLWRIDDGHVGHCPLAMKGQVREIRKLTATNISHHFWCLYWHTPLILYHLMDPATAGGLVLGATSLMFDVFDNSVRR
jgi:hypothetical protein